MTDKYEGHKITCVFMRGNLELYDDELEYRFLSRVVESIEKEFPGAEASAEIVDGEGCGGGIDVTFPEPDVAFHDCQYELFIQDYVGNEIVSRVLDEITEDDEEDS